MAKHRLYDARKRTGWCVRVGRSGMLFREWRGLARFSPSLVLTASLDQRPIINGVPCP